MTHPDPIYLDYAATTPVDPRVIDKMTACLSMEGTFGNSASLHAFGEQARIKIEIAREQVASLINAVPRNILFTASSTEATNLALKGVAHFYPNRGKHIITCKTEHRAVLDCCEQLEREGYSVSYLDVGSNGVVNVAQLRKAIREDTLLVSIMHVNNETGVKQDIAAIGKITRERGVFFHVDATQGVGRLPIDVETLPIDLMSFCAHKYYGPKGVGALYLSDRPRVQVAPLLHGGGQERKFRAGTLATHQIVGMGEASHLAKEAMVVEFEKIVGFRKLFWDGIRDLPDVVSNSDESSCLPHVLNVCFGGMTKEALLEAFKPLAFSTASACNTMANEPSHVLRAMGFKDERVRRSLRFSFGRMTSKQEICSAIEWIRQQYVRSCT